MNSDMELSSLNNNFKTYLNLAINDLCIKSHEILNKLKNFHKINIKYNSDFSNLNDCEEFLDKLKEKMKEIRLTKNNIDKKIVEILIYDEEKKNKLKLQYEKELEKLENEVIEGTKDSENMIHIKEGKMKLKLEEKENLILSMSDLGQDQESIINNYEKDELLKANKIISKPRGVIPFPTQSDVLKSAKTTVFSVEDYLSVIFKLDEMAGDATRRLSSIGVRDIQGHLDILFERVMQSKDAILDVMKDILTMTDTAPAKTATA